MDVSDIFVAIGGFIIGMWVRWRQQSPTSSHRSHATRENVDQSIEDLIQSLERDSCETIQTVLEEMRKE